MFPKSQKNIVFCSAYILQKLLMHIYVACISHEFISLFSEGWPIFWRCLSILIFAEIWYEEFKIRIIIRFSKRFNSEWVGGYYDLVGADIPWLCTKLTIPVRSGLHWNVWSRWTQTWHKEMQLPFLVFPLMKDFYTNRFKQIGSILRSISFNPWIVFVIAIRKLRTWEDLSFCVASKLLKTHS